MSTTISHDAYNSEFREVIVVGRIVYLDKHPDGEKTRIHLDAGHVLLSNDSINTLQAKIALNLIETLQGR